MPNSHVHSYVMEYCFSKIPPQYAILIKGAWGSGKTWFIKNIIEDIKAKDGKELYLSLYGLNSFTAIENEFYRALHPVLSSKGMAIAGKILTGTLKTALKIDFNGDGKDDGTLSVTIPTLNLPEYLKNTEGLVLIFDDVERCSIPIADLLGYINHFVEAQDYKVILVANEDELAKDERYYSIKEKLIGKSFEIISETDLAVHNFMESTNNIYFFETYLDEINKVYKESGYNNLRHLRQAFLDFVRLEAKLPTRITNCKDLMSHLIQVFFALTIEVRHGLLLSKHLANLKSDWMSYAFERKKYIDAGGQEKKPVTLELKDKYSILASDSILLDPKIWSDLLFKGTVEKSTITSQLLNSKYLISGNSPSWIRLWYFRSHTDQEFNALTQEVWRDFKKLRYHEIHELKHIVGMMLFFSIRGLVNVSSRRVVAAGKVCVRKLRMEGCIDSKSAKHIDDISSLGMAYLCSETEEFKCFSDYVRSQGEIAYSDKLPELGLELLKALQESPSIFLHTLNYSGSSEFDYRDVPILTYINPEDFLQCILNVRADELNHVFEFLRERYRYGTAEHLIREEQWILEIKSGLLREIESRKGTLFGYCLQEVVDRSINVALEHFPTVL